MEFLYKDARIAPLKYKESLNH